MSDRRRSRGVLVLGMHRSGTSLVTHLVSALGFEAAGDLMAPDADNPRGFWEHRDLARIHELFLHRAGYGWAYPGRQPEGLFEGRDAEDARRQIEEILKADFAPLERWSIKDPRLCRLLPLWLPVLERLDLEFRCIIVVRSPQEVASSLDRRDGLSHERSLMLWLRHLLEAERWSRGRERLWLDLDTFTADPAATTDRLADWLEPDREPSPAEARQALEAVYDAALLHHRRKRGQLEPIASSPWIEGATDAVAELSAAGNEPDGALRTLDRISAELREWDRLLPTTAEAAIFIDQQEKILRQSRNLVDRNESLRRRLDRLLNSRSWRWTRPFRKVSESLRGHGGDSGRPNSRETQG